MYKPIPAGLRTRQSFGQIEEVLQMPDLIEIQLESMRHFLDEGLAETFRDISPITDFTGNLVLEFIDYQFGEPKYPVEECKERDVTYAAPLRVKARLVNKETGEVKEQEVFMGDFPLMTENGTFVYNGAERVVVSQLVRSPGAYYSQTIDSSGHKLFGATMIPNRGAWLEMETDANDVLSVRVDRTRKIPATVLLRALGYGTNAQIVKIFGEEAPLQPTLDKDTTESENDGLLEIYKRLRPGEPPTVDSARSLLNSLFFDPRRYDLAHVGRYKLYKKLSLKRRVLNKVSADTIVARETLLQPAVKPGAPRPPVAPGEVLFVAGEVLVESGQRITRRIAERLEAAGVNEIYLLVDMTKRVKVIGNGLYRQKWQEAIAGRQLAADVLLADGQLLLPTGAELHEDNLAKLEQNYDQLADKCVTLRGKREAELVVLTDRYLPSEDKHISRDDIISALNYMLCLMQGLGNTDDIDHLGNRRLRCIGELLQNQFRIGLSRMERVVKERMTIQDVDVITPQALINIRPVVASIKEFFGSSQLSQFMDQTNPLAELSHKRRLSALGPGGLSRDRAGVEVRDVHHSHYGRICPIETPEGPNVGLIGNLSTYARINQYGFIETPYRVVDKENCRVTDELEYLTADEEDEFVVAQANAELDENNWFKEERVTIRYRDEVKLVPASEVDYMDVSPKQVFSICTTLIPFLEHDDASRALMGANMMKQAVPLLRPESPLVGTGMEYKAAYDSGSLVIARRAGVVEKVSSREVVVRTESGAKDVYKLLKFKRSNQGTCINQRPIVHAGMVVEQGQVLADGPSTEEGELALGRNVLCAFMPWGGYNYEDAILISERMVMEDVFTSIHIEEYESEARDTKLGPEEITRDIPNVGEEMLKDLDDRGIVRIGAEVRAGDILVGKVTPKGETELTAEERLLRAIFGEKAREVRDTSLKVPHGEAGKIVDVKVFTRENGDELPPGVNMLVRVYVAQKRKISEGDKMAGRHGNKGVIARILPVEDMPFLPDGTPMEIVLNPLGVPSRMNVGQVLETHLGWAAKALGLKMATPVFDGATGEDIENLLERVGRPRTGKTIVYDGRTGKPFDNEVTVGYVYMLKLFHLVDDKIHARSTGPYSLVTQQPLGGKAQFGGQRFGEMEVWALEAYGASYTLQEILTVKSDDVVGRVRTYEAIVKGDNVPEPSVPESFKVLIKELQSLGMNMKVFSADNEEIEIREYDEDINDSVRELNLNIEGMEDDDLPSRPARRPVPKLEDTVEVDSDEGEAEESVAVDVQDDEQADSSEPDTDDFDADALAKVLSQRLAGLDTEDADEEETPEDDGGEEAEEELSLEQKLAQLSSIIRPRLEMDDNADEQDDSPKPAKTARGKGRPSKDEN
jgi:DNA-directed RNA polymerase subunit beta